jgi:hypothetical protein
MLIFYIRAIASLEIAFAVTQIVFRESAMWLMIIEPRLGLSILDIFLFGGYGLPDTLPSVAAVVLLVAARRIVASAVGLTAYITFEGIYFCGWGALLLFSDFQPNSDGSPWSVTNVVSYSTLMWLIASGVPLVLAIQSLLRLRLALATATVE